LAPHAACRAGTAISRLCIAKQNSRGPPSSAALRPLSLRSAVQARTARRRVIVVKAAMGAADPTKETPPWRPIAMNGSDSAGVPSAPRLQEVEI